MIVQPSLSAFGGPKASATMRRAPRSPHLAIRSVRPRVPVAPRAPVRHYSSAGAHLPPRATRVPRVICKDQDRDHLWAITVLAAAAIATVASEDEDQVQPLGENVGKWRDGLPVYTRADVQAHKTKETRIWVTFKAGVYDITDFVPAHPGQEKILMAAGGSIEPFWAMYGVHNNLHIGEMLEELRIGNLDPKDQVHYPTVCVWYARLCLIRLASIIQAVVVPVVDLYMNEPERDPRLVVRSAKPFNAEMPLSAATERLTPNELFYVRNHLPVPEVDPEKCDLNVSRNLCYLVRLTHSEQICTGSGCGGQATSEVHLGGPATLSVIHHRGHHSVRWQPAQ